MINTKFYELFIDSQTDIITTPWSGRQAEYKSCELREHPTGAILSQASNEEGATTIPQGSTHKCVEAQGAHAIMSDDMVLSAWQHAAVIGE